MKRSVFLASGFVAACLPHLVARAQPLPSGDLFEQYVASVVAKEMPASWPAAALQAQAICTRTYYAAKQRNAPASYDLISPLPSPGMPKANAIPPSVQAAVAATTGKVLQFHSGIADIAYSACCGGRTESSMDAWGTVDLPYLRSIACPWCQASPDYRWQRSVSLDDLNRMLRANQTADPADANALGIIQTLAVASTDKSGRARDILVGGTLGSVHVVGRVFRQRIGSQIVRSLYIQRIDATPGAFAIQGGGYGHGVGLCQWGAKGMAVANRSAEDILAFYFPGTTVGPN